MDILASPGNSIFKINIDPCLDLESIIGDSIDPTIKERIIIAVNQSRDKNQMKVQALDSTIRKLYEAASGLVNNRAESLRGYGFVHAVHDIRR